MLEKRFGISSTLYNAFDAWARNNPELVVADAGAVVLDFAAELGGIGHRPFPDSRPAPFFAPCFVTESVTTSGAV
jgi:hypothetical protein